MTKTKNYTLKFIDEYGEVYSTLEVTGNRKVNDLLTKFRTRPYEKLVKTTNGDVTTYKRLDGAEVWIW